MPSGLRTRARRVTATVAIGAGAGLALGAFAAPATAGTPYAAPVNVGTPRISGPATQAQTLRAAAGFWLDSPTSYAYQWEDCSAGGAGCVPIAGATTARYTLAATDVAETIRVSVTATNALGSTAAVSSPTAAVKPLAPASTALPAVGGSAIDGQTLTVSPGAWSNGPTSFIYGWQDCDTGGGNCTPIAGATAGAYTLTPSDVGDTIRAAVTAANAGGSTTTISSATGVVGPALVAWANVAAPQATQAPVVTGNAAPGQTLTCTTGDWAGGPTSFSYQWNRANLPIADATDQTYPVAAGDEGHTLSCSVVAANAGGAIQADSAGVLVGAGQTSAGGVQACTAPGAVASGQRLGPVRLGETEAQLRRRLAPTAARAHADTFCLSDGGTIQAAYASGAVTASVARTRRASAGGRVVLALTDDPRCAVDRIRPGMTTRAAARRHRLGRVLRLNGSDWYVLPGARVNAVVEIRGGRVAEVGIAARRVSAGRAAARRLLRTLAR